MSMAAWYVMTQQTPYDWRCKRIELGEQPPASIGV